MRLLAKILGITLLLDGTPASIEPKWWFKMYKDALRPHLPENVADVMDEYGKLSDKAIRSIGLSEVLIGMVMLSVANTKERLA